eukprot:2643946-Ditylum_brightwellii.AAC.1
MSARSNQGTLPTRYYISDNDSSTLSDPNLRTDDESGLTTQIITGRLKRSKRPKKDNTNPVGKHCINYNMKRSLECNKNNKTNQN